MTYVAGAGFPSRPSSAMMDLRVFPYYPNLRDFLGQVDKIAERIQTLGGVSLAMAHDIAETTKIPRTPRDREDVAAQFSHLLEAHELVSREVRQATRRADELGDLGTNDLFISDVLRVNAMQVWFFWEHLVSARLTQAGEGGQL